MHAIFDVLQTPFETVHSFVKLRTHNKASLHPDGRHAVFVPLLHQHNLESLSVALKRSSTDLQDMLQTQLSNWSLKYVVLDFTADTSSLGDHEGHVNRQ